MTHQPFFSICIPAYNRSRFLQDLLDSIRDQSFKDYEVLLAEDNSPERNEIIRICKLYTNEIPLRLILNVQNLGYDKNLKQLINHSNGKYLLFLGNDDLLGSESLATAHNELSSDDKITCAIRSYSVFSETKDKIKYTVKYFPKSAVFSDISRYQIGVRRFGVLSGLIFDSFIAKSTTTDYYDGALYYQTYLGIECLKRGALLYIGTPFTYSRDEVAPDFGNSSHESSFTPGRYTPEARLKMLAGVTSIYKKSLASEGLIVVKSVERDYATFILSFFKDQVSLDLKNYFRFWMSISKLGYGKYARYHLIVWAAFILKSEGINLAERFFRLIRSFVGRK